MTKIDDTQRLEKNARIKASISATRKKRKSQQACVRKIKVIKSKCSKKQLEQLARVFLEAKWLRNTCLAWMEDAPEGEKRYPSEYKKTQDLSKASVKMPDGTFEDRDITTLGSQLKQGVLNEMSMNIQALAAVKKKGRKVGALKFQSRCNSIELMQIGSTHKIKSEHKIKIQGITGYLYVRGMEQIPKDADFANAKLLKCGKDYYIALTYYIDKEQYNFEHNQYSINQPIGIDMGIKTHIMTSYGEEINALVPESRKLKTLQKRLAHMRKVAKQQGRDVYSKNYLKLREQLQTEYARLDNIKDDLANKIVHDLLEYEHVYMQDENLKGWKKNFGRTIHHSILGRVKAKLVNHPRVTVLKQWVATTQHCPQCSCKTKHDLSMRTYECKHCGYTADRDVNAANNMILLSQDVHNVKK